MRVRVVVLLIMAYFVQPGGATEVALAPTDDAWVSQNDRQANFGGESRMVVGYVGIDPSVVETQAYLRFDLGTIPTGSRVESGVLTLYTYRHEPTVGRTFAIDRVTGGDWTEGELTWSNRPGCVCLPQVADQGDPGFWSFDVTSIVQTWVDGHPNQGLRVTMELSLESGLAAIRTKEFANPGLRPRLDVRFTSPEVLCRFGTVGIADGDPTPVLFANDEIGNQERCVDLSRDEPLLLSIESPPAVASSRFVLYAFDGVGDAETRTPLPMDVGCLSFSIPGLGGGDRILHIWNNLGFGSVLGRPTLASSPAPTTLFALPRGTRVPVEITFQAILEDPRSLSALDLSASNAIVVKTF